MTDAIPFYSGTSGLLLPVRNKAFYPPEFQSGSRLTYYSHLFNSIEVNSSFYKVPMARTVDRWVKETPHAFRFTFKLWKGITHAKKLQFDDNDVLRFMDAIRPAAAKAGCLLIQFPAGLHENNLPHVERLLHMIDEADPNKYWTKFLEFRREEWYSDEMDSLLERHRAYTVSHDKPGGLIDLRNDNSDQVYLRFHGPSGNYRGSYTDDFVYEYANYIVAWLQEGKHVYVYFNNTMGDAIGNLQRLRQYVNEY